MKMFTKFFVLLFVSFSLISCATSGPKFTELAPSISKLPPDVGRIYVYRVTSFGALFQPDVKLNGEVVGKSTPKGFFYIDRKPGTYEILTSTEVDRKLSLTLEKGQTRYVRLNVSMGFFAAHIYPELVDSETAESEIQDCHFIGQENKLSLSKINMESGQSN